MGVCIKTHSLTCFQQAHSGPRPLALGGKHGDGAGSLPPEVLNISTCFAFTLKNVCAQLRERALMSDIRTDISIIFQKRNSKSMVQVALKGQKNTISYSYIRLCGLHCKKIYNFVN